MDKSAFEFAAGEELNGSELLWGAAAHALITVAQENGWPYDSHGALLNVTARQRQTIAGLNGVPISARPSVFTPISITAG